MSARHARPSRAQARAGRFALQPQPVWVSPDRVREPARPYRRGGTGGLSRRQRLLRASQQMLATAAAVTAAGLLGVAGTNGTFALWTGGAEIDGGSISSGEAALELGGSLPEWTNALPGEQQHFAFSVANAGDVDLAVTTRIDAELPHFEIRSLIIGALQDCEGYDLDYLPALTTTADPTGTLIHADEELQVCAIVTALPEVEPGDSADFTLVLEGTQTP